jgi:hypothetical protein
MKIIACLTIFYIFGLNQLVMHMVEENFLNPPLQKGILKGTVAPV